MNAKLLANARAFLARGWIPTPLAGKKPILTNWTKLPPPSDGDLCRWDYEGRNFGVRTGGDLIIVDVDQGVIPEILAKLLEVRTPTVRTGRDGWHFYLKGNGRCSVGKISEHVDVRGEGGQAVMPGSIHPDTGKAYEWYITPEEAELAPYPPWLDAMADAAVKIRKAPAGKRNDTLNKATYAAAKLGAPTRELADAAHDAGLEHGEIEATINSATRAAPIPSLPQENEILVPGEHFFGSGEGITINQTDFVKECWKRIPESVFYNRLGATGEIFNAQFQITDATRFRYIVSQYLPLCHYAREGRSFVRKTVTLSPDLGALILAAGREHTLELRAITKYPLFGGPHKGWISLFDGEIDRSVTDHRLFWETALADFPFATANDLYGIVLAGLTLIIRPVIDGPVPIFLISAAQPGTGKTKLVAEFLARLIYGRPISGIALSEDDAEVDKRLISLAATAHTVFFFDNVTGKVDCPVLAAFSTATSYSARILGQSKTAEFSNDALIFITANNAVMSEELARRTWNIRLEAKIDHPEARTDFVHAPLGAYLDSIRAKALGSLLTMAETIGPGLTVGSYEEWGRIACGVMAAHGMQLSQAAFRTWMEQTDDASADLRSLVKHWAGCQEGERYTLKAILNWIKSLEIMPRILDCEREHSQLIRLGRLMNDAKGRVMDGWQIQSAGSGTRREWFLVRV